MFANVYNVSNDVSVSGEEQPSIIATYENQSIT